MAVTSQVPLIRYIAGGGTEFSFPFRVPVAEHLKVFVSGVQIASGYSLTGVGEMGGGTLTFDVAPPAGTKIVLARQTPIERSSDYVEGGALRASELDDDFDALTYMVQDIRADAITTTEFQTIADQIEADKEATFDAAASAASSASTAIAARDAAAGTLSAVVASANAASTSANQANNKAIEAAASASSASTSATNAAGSASAALASANTATTQASNASASAVAAAASATSVAGEASAAASSAAAAAASYDAFDDRYLGSKASDPTLDNDGNALLEGALYWNTTSQRLRVRSAGAWTNSAPSRLVYEKGYLSGAVVSHVGIPAWATRIVVSVRSMRTTGSTVPALLIAGAGGYAGSVYNGGVQQISTALNVQNVTGGVTLGPSWTSGVVLTGDIVLTKTLTGASELWNATYLACRNDSPSFHTGAFATATTGPVTQLQLSTRSAETFSDGLWSVSIE
jgi:hypothetical protein